MCCVLGISSGWKHWTGDQYWRKQNSSLNVMSRQGWGLSAQQVVTVSLMNNCTVFFKTLRGRDPCLRALRFFAQQHRSILKETTLLHSMVFDGWERRCCTWANLKYKIDWKNRQKRKWPLRYFGDLKCLETLNGGWKEMLREDETLFHNLKCFRVSSRYFYIQMTTAPWVIFSFKNMYQVW